VPGDVVRRQGASESKVRRYPGLKESLYVGNFEPNPEVVGELGIDRAATDVLVVVRSPPSRALYHRAENTHFLEVLEKVCRRSGVNCVALTRHAEQSQALHEMELPNLFIPERAVDARALMYEADLVIGAGGTMSREAALMGVPTVSVFSGPQPAADRWLEQRDALRHLTSVEQLEEVRPRTSEPRPVHELRRAGMETMEAIVAAVVRLERSTH
jgi:predicted glycosyltransferase